jgi:hypothetical protein
MEMFSKKFAVTRKEKLMLKRKRFGIFLFRLLED